MTTWLGKGKLRIQKLFNCTHAWVELVKSIPYIYIVIHRQAVSFYQNSSVWLDTQDARSRDRNPSNFTLD